MRMIIVGLCIAVAGLGIRTIRAGEADGWILLSEEDFSAWRGKPLEQWKNVKDVKLDSNNKRKLVPVVGKGTIYNGMKGRARNLLTRENYGDVELHLEFLMAERSNAGVKFHGHYEIQILDSYGKKKLTGADCGGIYPRAVIDKGYRHIDKGIAPRVNACKKPGEWQTLDVIFLAPRFDTDGKKTTNAKIVKAVLNGKVIHENLQLKTPTGHLWVRPEMAVGPIMLQGDHGPVAFRNVKIRKIAK